MSGTGSIGSAGFLPLPGRTGVATPAPDAGSARERKLAKAASDFEALLLTHILKSMRQSAEIFGDDEKEAGTGMMHEFADEQLAVAVARGGGLGLARMLRQRLLGEGNEGAEAVRHGGVPPRASFPARPRPAVGGTGPADVESIVLRAAEKFDLDPALLRAVIARESAGRPDAISVKGAKGLMQLMDGTARELGVRDPFDPEENVFGGARYLRRLLDRFHGDPKLALASYNAGPGAVERHGGVPPYPETERYVEDVIGRWRDEGGRNPRGGGEG